MGPEILSKGVFRHESGYLLQENGGRGITRSAIAADAQMSDMPGAVSFSGDGYRHSFCHGQVSADTTDCGLLGRAAAVCLAAVEGLEGLAEGGARGPGRGRFVWLR